MTNSQEKFSVVANAWGVVCPGCGECVVRTKMVEEAFPCGMGDPTILTAEVPAYECEECGFGFTDGAAEAIIEAKRQAQVRNLLSPEAIREIRRKLGLSRRKFTELTGFGEASVKRWETGALKQNVATDNFLRFLGDDPKLLEKLRRLKRVRKI